MKQAASSVSKRARWSALRNRVGPAPVATVRTAGYFIHSEFHVCRFMSKTLSAILTWPLRHPRQIALLAAMVAIAAAVAALRIHPDPSLKAMFSPNNPSAQALARVMDDFGAVDELLVVATIPDQQAVTPEVQQRLTEFGRQLCEALTAAPETAPLVAGAYDKPDPQAVAYFQKVFVPGAFYYLDDADYRSARERLTLQRMQEQLARDQAMLEVPGAAGAMMKKLMADPLRLREFLGAFFSRFASQRPFNSKPGTDEFLSEDGRNLLIRVRGRRPPGDLDFCRSLTDGVKAVATRLNAPKAASWGALELRYAGSYAVTAQSAAGIKGDMIASVTGSVICLQLLFVLAYRSPVKLFALSFGPIALGVLLGFGAYTFFTVSLTPMTAVLGGILSGMAIDYAIQYLSYFEAHRQTGESADDAARSSALTITPAAFGAWATSIVGFLAIGASSARSLRDFALLGTLGLSGAFFAKTALLPLLLKVTDRRPQGTPLRSRFRFGMGGLLRWVARRPRAFIAASSALLTGAMMVVLIMPGDTLPLETDLTVMHPRPNPAIDAQAFIAQRFGMHDWLMVDLEANSPQELVELAHRVDDRLVGEQARAAGVVSYFGLGSLLPDPRVVADRQARMGPAAAEQAVADFHAALGASDFVPTAREFRDYEVFLRELLTRPPPGIADLLKYPRLAEVMLPRSSLQGDKAPITRAITLVFISGSTDQRGPRDAAVKGIRTALAGLPGATLTGLDVVSHDTELTVRHDLPRLSLLAMGLVLVYLVFHFRNIRDAMLTLLPTAFSLIVLLAAMRVFGQKVNLVNLIAAPLLIGIDVDYGIFLVALARSQRTRRQPLDERIGRLAPVCHAIVICAAATIVGYGSLLWTSVPAIASLGFVVAVGIAACLLAVLFLLAPIFLVESTQASAP